MEIIERAKELASTPIQAQDPDINEAILLSACINCERFQAGECIDDDDACSHSDTWDIDQIRFIAESLEKLRDIIRVSCEEARVLRTEISQLRRELSQLRGALSHVYNGLCDLPEPNTSARDSRLDQLRGCARITLARKDVWHVFEIKEKEKGE